MFYKATIKTISNIFKSKELDYFFNLKIKVRFISILRTKNIIKIKVKAKFKYIYFKYDS